jgi:hypothetical protein
MPYVRPYLAVRRVWNAHARTEAMRTIWCLLGLSLTAASGYLTWFGMAERRAHAPETFVNLVAMLTMLCAVGAGLAWGRGFRKVKG